LTTAYREKIKPLLLCVTVLAPILRSLHSWQEKKNSQDGMDNLAVETRTVVMQELFDEVYMGEDHTPTAVSFKLQFIKGVTRQTRR
jgi:hypothetical protein